MIDGLSQAICTHVAISMSTNNCSFWDFVKKRKYDSLGFCGTIYNSRREHINSIVLGIIACDRANEQIESLYMYDSDPMHLRSSVRMPLCAICLRLECMCESDIECECLCWITGSEHADDMPKHGKQTI